MHKESAKPFIKWVGGKGQLLSQLEALLPADFDMRGDVTYVEPFIGGGAMLFHMLKRHRNIRHAVIGDANPRLAMCYEVVRDSPQDLIALLADVESEYMSLPDEAARKEYYLQKRREFNTPGLSKVETAALLMFLNRTCFNGLYRENRKGEYNVPFGRYAAPVICNAPLIEADSRLLQSVSVFTGDFAQALDAVKTPAFFYLDPPYRPLNLTSSFNDYVKSEFGDSEQVRLKQFCDEICSRGHSFMLSNSDCADGFFDNLYEGYNIERVWAKRCVNANGEKRGKLTEIVVRNYETAFMLSAI